MSVQLKSLEIPSTPLGWQIWQDFVKTEWMFVFAEFVNFLRPFYYGHLYSRLLICRHTWWDFVRFVTFTNLLFSTSLSTFWGPTISHVYSLILLWQAWENFVSHIWQNYHRYTNFVKSVKIVDKISSNMPFSFCIYGKSLCSRSAKPTCLEAMHTWKAPSTSIDLSGFLHCPNTKPILQQTSYLSVERIHIWYSRLRW